MKLSNNQLIINAVERGGLGLLVENGGSTYVSDK